MIMMMKMIIMMVRSRMLLHLLIFLLSFQKCDKGFILNNINISVTVNYWRHFANEETEPGRWSNFPKVTEPAHKFIFVWSKSIIQIIYISSKSVCSPNCPFLKYKGHSECCTLQPSSITTKTWTELKGTVRWLKTCTVAKGWPKPKVCLFRFYQHILSQK